MTRSQSVHATFRQDLKATAAKRQTLERELQALNATPAAPQIDMKTYQSIRYRWRRAKWPEEKREIIRELVTEVRLSDTTLDMDTVLPPAKSVSHGGESGGGIYRFAQIQAIRPRRSTPESS